MLWNVLHVPKLTGKPYYEVEATEEFTCYPLIPQKASDTALSPEESFRTGLRRSVSCQGMTMELVGISAGTFEMEPEWKNMYYGFRVAAVTVK